MRILSLLDIFCEFWSSEETCSPNKSLIWSHRKSKEILNAIMVLLEAKWAHDIRIKGYHINLYYGLNYLSAWSPFILHGKQALQ